MNAVDVIDVTKSFGNEKALDHVTVSFESGRIHGIIGRNGSGKTVLLKCISGFLTVDSGQILIDGKRVKPAAAQDIGLILETPGFIGSLSGFRNLKLLSSLRDLIDTDQIRKAMTAVGLDPYSRKHVSKYSLGMRHRLGIAQAIMEEPKLLILDEPMNGLDRTGVLEIRKLLKAIRERGTTILITSHYTEDIDALCDSVSQMDSGHLTQKN